MLTLGTALCAVAVWCGLSAVDALGCKPMCLARLGPASTTAWTAMDAKNVPAEPNACYMHELTGAACPVVATACMGHVQDKHTPVC
jgi:hypothetical protein